MFEPINNKEKVHHMFKRRPFIWGVVFALGLLALPLLIILPLALIGGFGEVSFGQQNFSFNTNLDFGNIVFWTLSSMFGIWILGAVLQTNGLKFVFSLKGFGKGMLALSPIIVMVVVISFVFVDEIGIYFDLVAYFPFIIINEFARVLQEEILFRGVLMTAVLIKLSPKWDKKTERIIYTFIFAVIFGLVHFVGGWYGILTGFFLGFLICASYIYAKNLLACIIVHLMANTLPTIIVGIISGNFDLLERLSILPYPSEIPLFIVFWIIQIITAVILIIKAKPFVPVSEYENI